MVPEGMGVVLMGSACRFYRGGGQVLVQGGAG